MYKIEIRDFEKKYLIEEMIKIFLRPDEYRLTDEDADIIFNAGSSQDKNLIKREVYNKLSALVKELPPWGILTGIRPVKLWGETFESLKNRDLARKYMRETYLIQEEKLDLIENIYDYQIKACGYAREDRVSVYIGIPFCPTRCLYCSFVSNQKSDSEIERYFIALLKEIRAVGSMLKASGKSVESLYIGGGTPTSLNAKQLDTLLGTVHKSFPMEECLEITVEGGRPDTINYDKLSALKDNKVDRISINPQTMKNETLDIIGRSHSVEMIINAFELAHTIGFKSINGDLIAGLPLETTEDFKSSIERLHALGPDNITVHCLAVKRASRLVDVDKDYHYKQSRVVDSMLKTGRELLSSEGYKPYYLYRQKHMAGAFENTGYCLDDKIGIYNIRIMDEHMDIVSLGAGGISKAYYPEENRLERIPNVSNYEEYINRVDEMIERKRKGMFDRR